MFSNNLKLSLRYFWKHKFYSFITVLGLAVGTTCCLLITFFVLDELSYDRFHEHADRIYRITSKADLGEQSFHFASSNAHLGEVLIDELLEVERVTRIDVPTGEVAVQYQDQLYAENGVLKVDSSFFSVFSYQWIQGDPKTALQEPASVAITQSVANKYFSTDTDIVGKTLIINQQPHTVTGIVEAPPSQAHFTFGLLLPYQYKPESSVNWLSLNENYTYVLLQERTSATAFSTKLQQLFPKYNPDIYPILQEMKGSVGFPLQAITNIHLDSHLDAEIEANGDRQYVYMLILIGAFILIIASINFINLSTARAAERAQEVGVRKTLGSTRKMLIWQFLTESCIISLLAILLALVLAELARGPFSAISGKSINLALISDSRLLIIVGILLLTTGVIAGLYPAIYLTHYQPVAVLRKKFITTQQGFSLRNALVVFQFVVSISLIICTLLIHRQLSFLQDKQLGVNAENVLIIENAHRLEDQRTTFMEQLQQLSPVLGVAASKQNPLYIEDGGDMRLKAASEDTRKVVRREYTNEDYLPTMQIQLLEGRNFERRFTSDSAAAIINQQAAQALGLNEPIGEVLVFNDEEYRIVGVTENFHFDAPQKLIEPLLMLLKDEPWAQRVIEVRLAQENITAAVETIEDEWQKFLPDFPLVYTFLDQDLDTLLQKEKRLRSVVSLFTGFTLLVACLGLLALAAFMTEQRRKEIGIRKVLGATVTNIVILLTKDFTKLVIIAFLLAIPIGYLGIQQWLKNFAYRTEISPGVFLVVGVIVLLLAWLTVSFQSIRAAIVNPVDSLQDE
ncbi:MAG: ABC transporter permease [Bacteroidota bacterium]